MGYVKELATQQGLYYRQDLDRGERFFGSPAVMVAELAPPPQASHVTGEYHQHKHDHTCREYWRAPFDADGTITGVYKVRYEAWREVPLKNGGTLHCGACWHERVVNFAKEIERVSLYYRDWKQLRYVTIPTGDYRKVSARIRKHNQRHDEAVNHTSFPLKGGKTVVLHDAPDWLGGDVLPQDRPRLLEQVGTWADTPKGKRAGRGFSSWGIVKDEGDGKKEGKGQQGGEPKRKHAGYIFGGGYGLVARAVAEYLDIAPHAKATKTPGLKAKELVDLLDKMGREYAIDGEIPGVTDNTSSLTSNTTVKRDTPQQPKIPIGESGGHEGERSTDTGPDPVYFGGEYVY